MNMIKQYKEIIAYLFFGGCTTLVNILSYYVCAHIFSLNTVISTVLAWILSVVFAYVTNRLYVFQSNARTMNEIVKEMASFFACRVLTGLMDLVIMYVFVDILLFPDMWIKIISNILVIILNYVASKCFIFTHKKKGEGN